MGFGLFLNIYVATVLLAAIAAALLLLRKRTTPQDQKTNTLHPSKPKPALDGLV
jgi:hypothetical protein